MGSPNEDPDMINEWKTLPDPALYDDDDGDESNVMLSYRPSLDHRLLEHVSIVDRYASDGWLLDGFWLEWTNN